MLRLRKYFDYSAAPITDGTFSIVSVGGVNSTATNKYTFAGNLVTPAAALLGGVTGPPVACGNATIGLFMYSGNTTNGCLYTYASNARASKTLSATVDQGCAGGNDVTGLICRGSNSPGSPLTMKYSYSGTTFTPGTNLLTNAYAGGVGGIKDHAIIALGGTTTATNRYTYAGDGVTSATNLSAAVLDAPCCGNANVGVFSVSYQVLSTTKYVYASDTSAAGGSKLFVTMPFVTAASGISTVGLFASSGTNPPSLYSYSSDTCTAGTAFTQTNARGSLANGTQGVTI